MQQKPGYKTTEFWLVVSTAIVASLNRRFHLNITPEEFMTFGGAVIAYAISRGVSKKKP